MSVAETRQRCSDSENGSPPVVHNLTVQYSVQSYESKSGPSQCVNEIKYEYK